MNDKINLDLVYAKTISLALQQNQVPIIRLLTLENNTDEQLQDLTINITTDPLMSIEYETTIAKLAPKEKLELSSIQLKLSATYLFNITEKITGNFIIKVLTKQKEVIAQLVVEASILSYDEWAGSQFLPEIMAAYVTPNHPYIVEIIKKAAKLLQKWDNSPSFSGYQTQNPNIAKLQMAAIYGALQSETITYVNPPASFEKYGQRVRLADKMQTQKMGTCLDLALLYASCLEFVGLHPLIILLEGHAFTGCWLEEEYFPECIQDDLSVLTKRIADGINEICVVETTAFVAGNKSDFDTSVKLAEASLKESAKFNYLVDIKRARKSYIHPLPLQKSEIQDLDKDSNYEYTQTQRPVEMDIIAPLKQVDHIELTHQQIWERKLLDLSLRNALINFKVKKNTIQLLIDTLPLLEDALSGGDEFQILPCPDEFVNTLRDSKMYVNNFNEDIQAGLIKSEFAKKRIRTYLDEANLTAGILSLYREAKLSMEESGVN